MEVRGGSCLVIKTDVLLGRVEDQYYAVQPNCTHYGVPLEKGSLCGKELICP